MEVARGNDYIHLKDKPHYDDDDYHISSLMVLF